MFFCLQLVEEMAEEVIQVESKAISAEVLREARNDLIKAKMEEERLKEEQEAACAEVVDDLVSQLVEEVAVEEMEVVEQRKKLHRYLAMAECVMGDVLGDTLAVLIEDTAAQVLTSLEEERELKVKGQVGEFHLEQRTIEQAFVDLGLKVFNISN